MKKIVLIGAGSANFGLEAVSDIYKSKTLEGSKIMLHDINKEALEKTKNTAEKYKEKLNANYIIEASTSREEALTDAHYCLISIQ